MAEKRRNIIPTSIFNPYHVYLWAGDKLSTVQKYGAAIKMYKEAEENANENKEMLPISDKRSRAYLHMGNVKMAEIDAVEGLRLDQGYTQLIQARGDVLLEKNMFEDALGTYQRGYAMRPLPPRFQHGIAAAKGTVMDTLGPRAGNLMSDKRLGKVVKKMKLKELDIAYPPEQYDEISRRKKEAKMKQAEEVYTDTYLGKAAKHFRLMDNLQNSDKLYLGNTKQNIKIKKLLRKAVERLTDKKGTLWRRNPLYVREQDLIPKTTQEFFAKKAILKKKQLEHHILSEINAIDTFLRRKDYVDCFKRGDALRHHLFEQSDKDLPFKREAISVVIHLLGDMFLHMKKIHFNWNVKLNDERVQYIMGIEKPYKMAHDFYRDGGLHPVIAEVDEFLRLKKNDLDHCTDPLEESYLCHELAVAFSFKGRPLIAGTYSELGARHAKEAGSPVWYLNCLFMLARVKLQARDIRAGQLTLAALKKATKEMGFVHAYHFAERAMALSGHEKSGRLTLPKADLTQQKCNTIVNVMATEDQKIEAARLIQEILNKPPHKRFGIAKGPKPDKSASKDKKKSSHLEKQEQNIYVSEVLIDKRDPNDMEKIEKEILEIGLFNTSCFKFE